MMCSVSIAAPVVMLQASEKCRRHRLAFIQILLDTFHLHDKNTQAQGFFILEHFREGKSRQGKSGMVLIPMHVNAG